MAHPNNRSLLTIPINNFVLNFENPCLLSGHNRYNEARIVSVSMTIAPIDEVIAMVNEIVLVALLPEAIVYGTEVLIMTCSFASKYGDAGVGNRCVDVGTNIVEMGGEVFGRFVYYCNMVDGCRRILNRATASSSDRRSRFD